MEQLQVTLPDGKVQEVPKGTTPADIARKISPRLADAALVARVTATNGTSLPNAPDEGQLIDLRCPLQENVKLQILTEKDPDALFVFRHSAAHLLAAAVTDLYPNVKLGIGPPIDTGFFYEFLRDEPFTPEDLAKIEKKMHELASQDLPNERKLIPKPEALDLYKKSNQIFKCELVEEKAVEPMVSFYTTGKFIDFCRGPHVPSTTKSRPSSCFPSPAPTGRARRVIPSCSAFTARPSFSSERSGRISSSPRGSQETRPPQAGRELDLFSVQEQAGPGLIFWHPKGGLVRKIWKTGSATSF